MTPEGEPTVIEATDAPGLALARALFVEYARSLPFALDYQGFDAEMASLPGKYARPGGCILLASPAPGAAPVGCIALRPLDPDARVPPDTCEMKRMYVRPEARGLGLGRLLGERLIAEARGIGYERMYLDSESTFIPAVTLYRSLGFRPIPRYNDDPMPDTVWMSLELRGSADRIGG